MRVDDSGMAAINLHTARDVAGLGAVDIALLEDQVMRNLSQRGHVGRIGIRGRAVEVHDHIAGRR